MIAAIVCEGIWFYAWWFVVIFDLKPCPLTTIKWCLYASTIFLQVIRATIATAGTRWSVHKLRITVVRGQGCRNAAVKLAELSKNTFWVCSSMSLLLLFLLLYIRSSSYHLPFFFYLFVKHGWQYARRIIPRICQQQMSFWKCMTIIGHVHQRLLHFGKQHGCWTQYRGQSHCSWRDYRDAVCWWQMFQAD